MKYLLMLISLNCFSQDAIQIYILDQINEYRSNPCKKAISDNIYRYDRTICNELPTHKLIFDEAISEGCFDWAQHLYYVEFEHSNETNFNESIFTGLLPKCVKDLILDTPGDNNLDANYGHRKHLLSSIPITKFDKKIGIGYYRISRLKMAIVIRTL